MLLSAIIFFPLISAIILIFFNNEKKIRIVAFALSLIELLLSSGIFLLFNKESADVQLVERMVWIKRFGINYFVGVDGISLWLIILTTFFLPLMVLVSWRSVEEKVKGFHVALFVLQTTLLGSFLAMDLVLFYVFWEFSLVPMYFIVGMWGGSHRIYAAVKLFIFTMAGSALMLVAIVYMMYIHWQTTGNLTASLLDFYNFEIPFMRGQVLSPQVLVFLAFCIAFAIKVPIFPFHTWLPDAHVEAPTAGSVVLAAVMLKMGTYALMRFALPLFPQAVGEWSSVFLVLGTVGIIYGAMMAVAQKDIKKLIAYSSVSHMGYVVVGLFSLNIYGITGGLYQMLNHGITTGSLFIMIGIIYERTHTREIAKYGGLASGAPLLSIFFLLFSFSSIAVPLTNNFIGEFLILIGAYEVKPIIGVFAVCGVILGAVYILWTVKRVFFGWQSVLIQNLVKENKLADLNLRELVLLVPPVILVFAMGIFPNFFLQWSRASIDHFVGNQNNYRLAICNIGEECSKKPSGEIEGAGNEH